MATRVLTIIMLFLGSVAFPAFSQTISIDSLKEIVATHRGDTTELKALENLVYEYSRKDLELARSYAWMEKSLAAQLQKPAGVAHAYSTLVINYLNRGKMDSSQYYLKELELLTKSSTEPNLINAYTNTAGLYYRNIGRPKEAMPFLLEALRVLGPDGDKTQRAGQLLNIANAYQVMSDFEASLKYYLQSLALFEEVGNKRGQSYCLQGLGNTYKDLNRHKLAESYYLKAEQIKLELGDKRAMSSTWMSLGALYQDMKLYEKSLQYATKGLAAAREQKNHNDEMKFLYNMGSIMISLNRPEEARKHLNASLKMVEELGDSVLMSRIKTDLIMLDADAKKVVDQEKAMIEHVEIASQHSDLAVVAEGREKLAQWYARNGKFDKAYEQIRISYSMADSIRGAEVQMQIKKMEEEYLGEKKDREIALLKKDQELHSVELSRQNTMITAVIIAFFSVVVISVLLVNRYRVVNNARRALEIERVRNSIARDLHDEMGSALSSINILSKVALVEESPVARQYLQNIGDQSEKMMENMGDMVWSINPRNDSIEKIIARMREFATEILDAKDIEYLFTDELPPNLAIGSEKRKNLFMIFKEAVNNAAKYSHATRMEIGLSEDKGKLVLTVKDNGKGFEEAVSRAGNGLRNMRERAGESGGSLSIRSAPGKGTEVQLRMSIA